MRPRNEEVVRRFVEALREGDYEGAASALHPDAEWRNTDAFPGQQVCCGPEEIKVFWQTFFDAFERRGMEVEKLAQSGETVVAEIHSWGTGRASGAPIDVRWATVYRLREGRILRIDVHGDYDKALEA